MRPSNLLSALLILVFCSGGCKKEEATGSDPVSDTEGNVYSTITVGSQIWMAENLRATMFNDGTNIALTTDAEKWNNLSGPGYCWYNNDETFRSEYGALYNGFTIATGKICPTGWHVPDKKEWQILSSSLGDSLKAGGKLKEAGTEHWLSPNKGADNSSGFKALPAGIRYFEGTFASIAYSTCFWSATDIASDEEWYAALYYADAALTSNHRNKKHGFSIRCLKD
jgi:uncharacterized protein (TIGR02145 family)